MDIDGNNPIIVDDGKGNLYSTNANSNFGTLAASNTSISSSDNFIGNIFYNQGLVLISETGSWSGSVKYSDLATNFTSSDFQPYITTINLYQKGDYDTPIIQATLPKPIRKSDKINMRFKIRLDL